MNKFLKAISVLSMMAAVAACSTTNDSSDSIIEISSPSVDSVDGDTITMQNALATTVFYFGFDSSELSEQDRSTLVYHAEQLKSNPTSIIRLEGHASEEGTREYNLTLGENRAEAISMFLIVNGASQSQIEVISYGEEKPANNGSTEEERALNRRVEIK